MLCNICVIVAASVIIRFAYAITVFLKADSSDVLLGTTAYFDYAQGTVTSLGTANNGAYLFVGILMRLFGLVNDDVICVYVLQAVLALGTILFTFFTLRKISGKVPAWIYILLAAFLPGSLELFMYCTPGLMLAFLFSGFFFGITHLIKAYQEDKITDSKIYVYFLLAGALAGFISYFDPIGLLLIPVTAYAIFAFRKVFYDDRKPEKHENTKLHITYFVGGAVGFLVFSLFAFPAGIGAGISGIARYFTLFVPKGLNLTILTPHYGNYDSLALYILAGLWFLAFLKAIRDRVFPMTVITIFMVLFCLFSFDHLDYSALVSTCFMIFACYGVWSLSFLILPVEAENVEQARQKLAEFDRKKRTKDNKRLEKKLEKQSKRAIKKGSGIVLGKNIEHEVIPDDEEVKTAENTAENTSENTSENTQTAEGTQNAGDNQTSDNTENKESTEAAAGVENTSEEPAKETDGSEVKSDENVSEAVASGESVDASESILNNEDGTPETSVADTESSTEISNNTVVADETDNVGSEGTEAAPTETIPVEAQAEANVETNLDTNVSTDITETANTETNEAVESTTDTETKTAENIETTTESSITAETTETKETTENTTDVENKEQKTEAPAEPPKRVLPPYVPQKMVRTRGKMFSPIKKAEPAPENAEPDKIGAELANVAVAVAAGAAVAGAVASTEEKKTETTAVVETEVATAETAEAVASVEASTEGIAEPAADYVAPEAAAEFVQEAPVEAVSETTAETTESVAGAVAETTEETVTENAEAVVNEESNVAVVPASPRFENKAVAESEAVPAVEETVASSGTAEINNESVVTSDTTTETNTETSGNTELTEVAESNANTETTANAGAETKATSSENAAEPEVKLIKNPVPGPKEHVAKELTFDYDPKDDELDFDLKDLNGKDFYDI